MNFFIPALLPLIPWQPVENPSTPDFATAARFNLNLSFDKVYFRTGSGPSSASRQRNSNTCPRVAIKVPLVRLKSAILEKAIAERRDATKAITSFKNNFTPDDYDSLDFKEFADAAKMVFFREATSRKWKQVEAVQWEGKDTLVIILPSEASINKQYRIAFRLEGASKSPLAFQSDESVAYSPRVALTATANLGREDVTLITSDLDGAGNRTNRRAKGAATNVSFAYQGIVNPLQGWTKEKSFYALQIEAVLTEQELDQRSKIALSSAGVTDSIRVNGATTIGGFAVQTSQSFVQTTTYFESGLRFGDRRANQQNSYISITDGVGEIYLETALQVGGVFYKAREDVFQSRNSSNLLLRPRATLGFNRLFRGSSLFEISGKYNVYYIAGRTGGSLTYRGLGEEFDVQVSLGKDPQRFVFSVKGGRNPSQNFALVRPVYGLGIDVKF